MNMIVTLHYIFLLSIVFYSNAFGAITINNKNINKVVKPGEAFTYENEGRDNIAFKIEKGYLTIGSAPIDDVQEVYDHFTEFYNEWDGSMLVKKLDLFEGSQHLEGKYIYSGDEMMINSVKTFSVYELLLSAERVCLSADKIETTYCFVKGEELIIQTRSEKSLYTIIKFTRDKNNRKPMVLAGSIDFSRANSKGGLVVLGAQSMTITFSSQAFK